LRALALIGLLVGFGLLALPLSATTRADGPGPNNLPIDPDWLAAELQSATNFGQFTNHVLPGAIAARNANNTDCPRTGSNGSQADYCRQEYIVVWSGKYNAGDTDAQDISQFIQNMTINPEGLADLAVPQFVPGMDALVVIDGRKFNANGSRNPFYGRVVNIATLSLEGGLECEPHHMQYSWINGENLVLGCLFTSWSFGASAKDIPNISMLTTNSPLATASGSIPDAFDAVSYDNANHANDTYIGTWMGGPLYNYGGSPGSLITMNGAGQVTSQTPAGSFGQVFSDPRESAVCQGREAEPVGTCANPHGIQARPDLGRMVTVDYAEPREIVLDPVKTLDVYAFRPTVRAWDITNPNHPVETSAAHVPLTWRQPAHRAHINIGIMEDAKTHAAPDGTTCGAGIPPSKCRPGDGANSYSGEFLWSKGMFAESMCGGGIFWTPDITSLKPVSTDQWHQVWDDGFSQLASDGTSGGPNSINGGFEDEPGGCDGGAWIQTTGNNRWLFHSVQGRVPLADNYFDQGSQKMVYVIDISRLVADGEKGVVNCDMNKVDPNTGIRVALEMSESAQDITPSPNGQLKQNPATVFGDCPSLVDVLIVHDPTTGGPHWADLDNHTLTATGFPTRLTFDDYFVARTGLDGDHRLYVVNIDRNGHLTYDNSFRDEQLGSLGVNFNRRDWIPNNGQDASAGYEWPDGGFYKPHAMLWVCPPTDCADDIPAAAG
jgi:hypothetical protein